MSREGSTAAGPVKGSGALSPQRGPKKGLELGEEGFGGGLVGPEARSANAWNSPVGSLQSPLAPHGQKEARCGLAISAEDPAMPAEGVPS